MKVKEMIELLKLCQDQESDFVVSYPDMGYGDWLKTQEFDITMGEGRCVITVGLVDEDNCVGELPDLAKLDMES